MDYTTNYQLPVWAETDRILMEDFNDMTEKIEAAMSGFGNCQIYTATYVGTGTHGPGNWTTVTFPVQPLFVAIIAREGAEAMFFAYGSYGAHVLTKTPVRNQAGWTEDNTLQWCLQEDATAQEQMNAAGRTYRVVALLERT